MRASITGGLGFIGSALGANLAEAGHDVRLSDIRAPAEKSGMDFLQGSVLNMDDCKAICEGVDVVIHSAAIHDAKIVANNPLGSVEINVTGTLNLLQAAVASGARRFIYLSSAKVFGSPANLPSIETDFPVPREAYALSKMMSEYYCHMFQAQSNLEVVIIRPYSVYGPAQELGSGYVGMILSTLINGSELRLPGKPDFVRDFVHIDDISRLCAAAAIADLPSFTVLNAGSGQPTTLRDLLILAAKISGKDLDNQYHAPSAETLVRMQACMKNVESLLGYRPMHDLSWGLEDTFSWFMEKSAPAEKFARR